VGFPRGLAVPGANLQEIKAIIRGHGRDTRCQISTPPLNQRFTASAKSLQSPCIILDLPNRGAESHAKLSLLYQPPAGRKRATSQGPQDRQDRHIIPGNSSPRVNLDSTQFAGRSVASVCALCHVTFVPVLDAHPGLWQGRCSENLPDAADTSNRAFRVAFTS
jgi:hypothetical protein